MIPSGAMIELSLAEIGEGDLCRQANEAIAEAHAVLARRRDRGYSTGKFGITIQINLEYDPDMRETVAITHSVQTRSPKEETRTLAREKGGMLLVQPVGSTTDSPDQMRLFDATGKPMGVLDRATGEMLQEMDVAGKVVGGVRA